MRCPYRSMVTWIDECPSRVWMVLGCSPAAISHEAWVWRRSCGVHGWPTDSATALRQTLLNDPLRRNPPCGVVHTSPSTGGWEWKWMPRVSVTILGSVMVRSDAVVFGAPSLGGTPAASMREVRTVRRRLSMSMLPTSKPASSPQRSPV